MVDIAALPGTVAITAVIATAVYLAGRIMRNHQQVLAMLAAAGVAIVITTTVLNAAADSQAARVQSGRPLCSGAWYDPYRLCAQPVTVTPAATPGVDLTWLPNGEAL